MAGDTGVTATEGGQEFESQFFSPFRSGETKSPEDHTAPDSAFLALPWAELEGTKLATEEDLEDLEVEGFDYDRELDLEDEDEDETEQEAYESVSLAEEEVESEECCGSDHELTATELESTLEPTSEEYAEEEETFEASQAELENEEEFDASEASAWVSEWEDEQEAAAHGLPAGSSIVDRVPLLREHRGIGPDLILAWNDINGTPSAVDVVVHLHGYSLSAGSRLHIVRDLKPRSGLDWADPSGGSTAPGRTRPTLALLPRGHFYGGTSGRAYSFPALTAVDGLRQLVDFGLQQLVASLGVANLARGRLILTAHSGGGAALLRILRHVDPHEVHVFDGLYQDAEALTQWATRHILRDQSVLAMATGMLRTYMAEQGGALRVLYGSGTAHHSRVVAKALAKLMTPDSPLRRWYRAERTTTGHLKVPPVYGWRLLADASADVPNAAVESEARAKRSLHHESTEELAFEDEGPTVTVTGAVVAFPSGATLPVIVGPGTASINDDFYDPIGSGNPLLDTSGANKDIKLSKNFTVRELTTTGGKSADIARIDPNLVQCLQQLRDHLGKGITITSGFRSWKRNRDVYAARKKKPTLSQHCGGRAADIKISGMNGLDIAKAAIDSCGPKIGIGVGDTYAHIDVRGVAQAWNYGGATKDWVLEVKRYQREKGGSSSSTKTPSQSGAKPPEELVRFAQRVLNATENERLDTDGKLGRLTRAALERFRSKYSLGPGDALDERTGLGLAQRALEQLAGQSMFRVGVTDPKTMEALADFRRTRGIGFDGSLDAATRAALGEALSRYGGVVTPVGTGGTSAVPAEAGSTGLSLGIDVACVKCKTGNEHPKNWVEAKAQVPVDFAIIRSNYGVSTDKTFKRDWPKLRDAGIVRGAYLFLRFPHPKYNMKSPDPVSQAHAIIKTVGSLDESDFPPTVDVEFPQGGRKVTRMTAQQCLDGVRAAWNVLKSHYGVAPIIYTSGRVWKEDLDNLPAPDLVESPLWLARYPFRKGLAVYDARRVGGLNAPPVPPPWGDATNWWIHQYQGDAVKLPGFPTGDVDMNRFNIMVKGATGDRVKWVQRRLGIAQSGMFDAATEVALRAFQSQKGLPPSGMVDIRTFARLCWSNP